MIGEVPNDYLNPNTSSMKMINWNCQGVGSVTFHKQAYELHCRQRPNILIIIERYIAEARAQAVINTLPYTHTLDKWILLVSPEAFGCYGMEVLPSK